jgi:hypothetical protein
MQKLFEGVAINSEKSYPTGMGAIPAPTIAAVGAPRAAGQIAIPAGKSVFDGFDELKKLFEKKHTTAGFVFPKAYCIARAMTLLNPVFAEELPPKLPHAGETQVCSAQYDFETGTDGFMPRANKTPKANIYLKSFVALFYDTYSVLGSEIRFTQSEDGASKLRRASTLLAQIYEIPANLQATFLTSETRFKQFSLCSSTPTPLKQIYIKDASLRKELFDKVVQPMLKLQEQHTQRVNALLKTMFDMKGTTLKFSSALATGNKTALNALGYQAHTLLLDYYLKSEAYYIKGVGILESNKGKLVPL